MKKLLAGLMVLVASVGVVMVGPQMAEVSAFSPDTSCEKPFLNFRPWFKGLAGKSSTGSCVVGSPTDLNMTMQAYVWTIVLNILSDLFGALGYLAVGFIIFGGYMYILAKGDPGKIEKGKKILIAAVTGLMIAVLASFISNTIVSIISEGVQ